MSKYKEALSNLVSMINAYDLHVFSAMTLDALREAEEALREPEEPEQTREEREAQFFSDIMDAATYCIGTWGTVRNYVFEDNSTAILSYEIKPDDNPFPHGDPRNKWQTIGRGSIGLTLGLLRGNTKYMSEDRTRLALEAWDDLDASNIDADIADCIVQIAAFGEVVFG